MHQPFSQTCNEKRLWTKEKLSIPLNSLYLMLKSISYQYSVETSRLILCISNTGMIDQQYVDL